MEDNPSKTNLIEVKANFGSRAAFLTALLSLSTSHFSLLSLHSPLSPERLDLRGASATTPSEESEIREEPLPQRAFGASEICVKLL
ncbi:hypothetical protein LR48_Vigan03g034400 [Vigna angularis]|uniref:Uncharacterized protein n=1 Tax=Phaseolus angularis TaxID=3914 RepID=A0A0L9U2D1_PHAAN|nr:hypothetical protein LR48_Vigan03g034400 [Vigna angularis]